ncbi:MAG: hypothetical protein V1784_03035 [bacterium]
MTQYASPFCFEAGCTRFSGMKGSEYICDAFPEGIPEDIFLGKVLHLGPYEGDYGIQYDGPLAEQELVEIQEIFKETTE